MKRLSETEVTDQAVKFAGMFVAQKFSKGGELEKSIVLNTSAHGFFMAARWIESRSNAPKWKFWIKEACTEDEIMKESISAADAYIKANNYRKVEFGTLNLIKACLSNGFREGLEWRKSVKE